MKKLGFIVGLFAVGMGLSAVACGGASEVDPDEAITGDDQEVRVSSLAGSWADSPERNGPPPGAVGLPEFPSGGSGPPPGAMGLPDFPPNSGPPPGAMGLPLPPKPAIKGIVFDTSGGFFADAKVFGSTTRITGTYSVSGSRVKLESRDALAGRNPVYAAVLGTYRARVGAAKLTLTKDGVKSELYKRNSYCAAADDCYGQNIITPACLGGFSCTTQNTCSYSCGIIN